jgi:hypothetical protein
MHDGVGWSLMSRPSGAAKVKRVGHGLRNFDNYRLRLLSHCGVRWPTHRTARLRGRSRRLVP